MYNLNLTLMENSNVDTKRGRGPNVKIGRPLLLHLTGQAWSVTYVSRSTGRKVSGPNEKII